MKSNHPHPEVHRGSDVMSDWSPFDIKRTSIDVTTTNTQYIWADTAIHIWETEGDSWGINLEAYGAGRSHWTFQHIASVGGNAL